MERINFEDETTGMGDFKPKLKKAIIQSLSMLELLSNAPKPITENTVNAFFVVMEADGISPDQIRSAAVTHLKTSKWFPAPSELLEIIKGTSKLSLETRATLAWEKVRSMTRRVGSDGSWFASDLGGDGAALWAVERIGLQDLNDMTSENRTWIERDFRKLYAAAIDGDKFAEHIPGNMEIGNVRSGYAIVRPGMIGRGDLSVSSPAFAAAFPKALEASN